MRRLLTLLGLDGIFDAYSEASPTTIGRGITLRGEIRGEGSVSVLGQFEGDIVLDGTLHVGPEGRVDANITAHAIIIAGLVHGNLSAETRVEILPTGALAGTVKSRAFSAADGASVKGEVWLDEPAEPAARAEERRS